MHKTFNLSFLYWLITLSCLTSCNSHSKTNESWKFEDGYIPNSVSAIKVAEIVWLNVYGSEINDEKPFIAKLKDGKVWIVVGTFNGGKHAKGGVAYIEIQKSDGKILKVIHGK
ncbi:YbbC/YhhH family protein [Mucilaginibacter sp. OK098]|uniref:YbbC/YhhH family protein n=1 Tax=Mucilaginibacter sp. OK098 TaxID=1855297 RepID=UPI000915C74B|nr:YbbC/YhhH family protein [Mucilaginibacter sp. OK098]SHM49602.1 NTF2 fold immunity protein [Mucilaginibacter sp. OK098]